MKSKQAIKFSQRVLGLAVASVFAALGVNSHAAVTATGTFAVNATVATSCTISGTALAFGAAVDATSGVNTDSTSTLTATCTPGTTYTIGLSAGSASGATVTTRKMVNGTDTLNYGLYTTALRDVNWDNTGAGLPGGTGTGAGQTYTVYGRIPSGQGAAKALAYSDIITATINF
ncbi:MAG TPA: spore coat U domain-containing protein [Burkholderiaceae bacterium]|jgi:spore coat protein U-like protein|nr:spore coat U domain-containing protein [Burkholderiaceae bacterium]